MRRTIQETAVIDIIVSGLVDKDGICKICPNVCIWEFLSCLGFSLLLLILLIISGSTTANSLVLSVPPQVPVHQGEYVHLWCLCRPASPSASYLRTQAKRPIFPLFLTGSCICCCSDSFINFEKGFYQRTLGINLVLLHIGSQWSQW